MGSDWQAFYDSLVIKQPSRPVEPTTESDILEFEQSTGLVLPASYKEYILVFGAGEFSASLEIAAPCFPVKKTCDLETAHASYGFDAEEASRFFNNDDATIVRRLYMFGLESGRNYLGWDLDDLRDGARSEYAVYSVGNRSAQCVAESFGDCVRSICDRIFTPDPDWDEEELGPQRTFEPAER